MQQVEHQSFDNKEILNKLKKLELEITTEDLVYDANPNNCSGFFRSGIQQDEKSPQNKSI